MRSTVTVGGGRSPLSFGLLSMRSLLKACGIGALSCLGLLGCFVVAGIALPTGSPLRRGLGDIMTLAFRPLDVFVPSSLAERQDPVLTLFVMGVWSACCGAVVGGFVWLSVHRLSRWSHKTEQ